MTSSMVLPGARCFSPGDVARNDRNVMAMNAQKHIQYQPIEVIASIFDHATKLLQYLERVQSNPVMQIQAAIRHGFSDIIDLGKHLTKLEHLIRSVQQAAFDVLLRESMKVLESGSRYWNKWFEQRRGGSQDWFSEWSSDRPPLNSTMPWNIKASLVVLWGVCWMFYSPNKPVSIPRHTPEESWYPQDPNTNWISQPTVPGSGQATAYSNPIDTSHLQQQQQQHIEPHLSYTNSSLRRRSLSARLSNIESSEIDMIGRMDSNYGRGNSMTQHSPATSHMNIQNNYSGQRQRQFSQQATPPGLDSHEPSISSTAVIRSPLPAPIISPHIGTTDIGDGPFATQQTIVDWSLPNHNSQDGYIVSHEGIWSQPNKYTDGIPQDHFYSTSPPVPSYTVPSIPTSSSSPGYPPIFSMRGHRLYRSSLTPIHNSRDITKSPRSVTTDMDRLTEHSPSLDNSGSSRHGSIISVEPPRDRFGNMTCDDPNCAKNPPIFTRKCEWKKHKDTHTRPYVCRVPGCEKIQGFTYSGGLLRHEREVHHQHGGPKLPRYCPHKDCKRSAGQGFSRKENLNEHLRRVHRGIGIEGVNRSAKLEPQSPDFSNLMLHSQRAISDSSTGRKRRRDALSGEDDHLSPPVPGISTLMNTIAELTDEVKSLRQEVAMKDMVISQLQQRALHMPSGGR